MVVSWHMAMSCAPLGIPFCLNSVVCRVCMHGVNVGIALLVASLASWSASSFPIISVFVHTFLYCYFVCGPLYLIHYVRVE
jgi:hypothetical protein